MINYHSSIVFPENATIFFIKMKEKSLRFEYHLSANSWLYIPTVGSSKSSNLLIICFSIEWVRNSVLVQVYQRFSCCY